MTQGTRTPCYCYIMISGFYSKGEHKAKPFIAIACFSECFELTSDDSCHSDVQPPVVTGTGNEQIKHLFSEEGNMSVLLGNCNDTFFFMSHLACRGKDCDCQAFVKCFLEESNSSPCSTTNNLINVLKTSSISPPFMLLFGNSSYSSCINGFHKHDIAECTFPVTVGGSCNFEQVFC